MMWTIFKAFIEFVTALFLFYGFWSFSHEACETLSLSLNPAFYSPKGPPRGPGQVLAGGKDVLMAQQH